jgi:TPR repeat protein
MASLEFYGIISGKPRYDKAYEYYKIASDNNHPIALWAIGYLFYNGYIGTKSDDDLVKAYEYFLESKKLKCSNAYNSLGLIYLNGNVPNINKDKTLALELFKQSADLGNIYANNNLGKLAEENKEYKTAYNYYLISANSGDSWALNKLGEYYRLGICKFVKHK